MLSALLDELPPFQEIFDDLAGNGDAISAHAEQVRSAGKAMQSDVIPDMAQATSSIRRTWQGDATDAFTQNSEALIGTCSAYVPITDRIAELELAIGAHVGEIRNLCRDTMADCLVRSGTRPQGLAWRSWWRWEALGHGGLLGHHEGRRRGRRRRGDRV
ncbi:MAG: hypothetical protein Q4G45_00650 [Actinomycetia bacterium]|nr:hypothetical protein [Actinomycetes bacterium]